MEYDLTKLLTPIETDFTLVRFGRKMDGGYIMPLELCKMCDHVLSFGIADDISFEHDFRKYNENAYIECYDGSIDALPDNNNNFVFHNKFIGPMETDTYDDINKLNINAFTCVKMDIEGAEYTCLNVLTDDKFAAIPILVMELHLSPDITPDRNVNDLILLLNRIEQYMFPIHVHMNNSWHNNFAYMGNIFCRSIEVTFINNIYRKVKYPIKDLDYPVLPWIQDCGLSWIKK